jgi:glycosyltransferase involved in cell wall biosynthesis
LGPKKAAGFVEERIGLQFRAASAAHRRPARGFLSTSEQVGFPLELMNRQRRSHVTLAHNLITGFKRKLHDRLSWLDWFDDMIVLSRALGTYLVQDIGRPADRVHVLLQGADTRFFRPDPAVDAKPDLVVAVGREHRDYPTFLDAMRRLPHARAIVVANSPWAKGAGFQSKHADEVGRTPSNVTFVSWLAPEDLRALYRAATVVAVPVLGGTTFAAGVNTFIEAQAMGKAPVLSDTPGMAAYADRESSIVVPPDDPAALAEAIDNQLTNDELRLSMNRAARLTAESNDITAFAGSVAAIAHRAAERRS